MKRGELELEEKRTLYVQKAGHPPPEPLRTGHTHASDFFAVPCGPWTPQANTHRARHALLVTA